MDDQAAHGGTLIGVRATFVSSDQMQHAVDQLSMSGFDRADLSLHSPALLHGEATPESGARPAYTGADAQQARTLGASTAAAAAAIAAAGITVATGGAAVPVIAAAVVAGGAAGGSVFAVSEAAVHNEQGNRDQEAANSELTLAVHAVDPAKRTRAEQIVRSAGATAVEILT